MHSIEAIPEFGLVFGLQLIAVMLHSYSIKRNAGRLHDSINLSCTL